MSNPIDLGEYSIDYKSKEYWEIIREEWPCTKKEEVAWFYYEPYVHISPLGFLVPSAWPPNAFYCFQGEVNANKFSCSFYIVR